MLLDEPCFYTQLGVIFEPTIFFAWVDETPWLAMFLEILKDGAKLMHVSFQLRVSSMYRHFFRGLARSTQDV